MKKLKKSLRHDLRRLGKAGSDILGRDMKVYCVIEGHPLGLDSTVYAKSDPGNHQVNYIYST